MDTWLSPEQRARIVKDLGEAMAAHIPASGSPPSGADRMGPDDQEAAACASSEPCSDGAIGRRAPSPVENRDSGAIPSASSGVEPLGDPTELFKRLRNAIAGARCDGAYPTDFAVEAVEALVTQLSQMVSEEVNARASLSVELEALRAERDGWHREAEINAQECAKQFNAWCGASAENAVLRQALRKIVIMVTPQEAMVIARAALSGVPAEKGEKPAS